jgi:peptidyl-prolyl cis-trans isomerase C
MSDALFGQRGVGGRGLALALLAVFGASGVSAGCSKKNEAPVAAASASASAGPKPLSPELAKKTLAKVGDRVITLGDYAATLERMDPFERMRYQSPERRRRLLDEMVEVELLAQEALRRGLDKVPETQERVRQVLRDQLLEEVRKGAPAANDVPEAELRAYYDAHKDEFAEPERRRVAAIVLDSAAAAKSALAKAQSATPAEWGGLVEKLSTQRGGRAAPNAPAELAGDLGIVGPPGHARGANPRVPEPVREAAFKLAELNQTHGSVVEADGKFYVIRVTSKTPGRERKYEESERAIRTAVVQARVKEREAAMEKDLRGRFPVKVDDAALAKMPMPPPAPPAPAVAPPPHGGVQGDLRVPSLSKIAGVKPPNAMPAAASPPPASAPQ